MSTTMSTSYPPHTSAYTKAEEIPEYCTKMAEILDQQPLFDGEGSFVKKCKVISQENWNDGRICEIFSRNARKILKDQAWEICAFEQGALVDSNRHSLNWGLMLRISKKNEMCPLETLQEAYGQVLERMTTGWKASSISDFPEKFIFADVPVRCFVKKRFLKEEDSLIFFIADKFSMLDFVECRIPRFSKSDQIYLCIRKSAFEEVVDKLGFKFL